MTMRNPNANPNANPNPNPNNTLQAETKRAASLDRLLQTYARDAYKRVGYDQVALSRKP